MANPAYLVAVGGIIGALLRHLVSLAVERESFPTGTLTVNVLGSFVLGLLTALDPGTDLLLLVGTGACGAFTTFSSFSFNVVRLWEGGDPVKAAAYAVANIVGALAAIGLARVVASLL
ncbi:fluoride efflux transporter CrcB [Haloplanus aerogenes]|uniref:Fluoride-specific ion channel FluC n=1 Tax=Haloplanus aerogenes TaxID=660522 RepID=A0A3M0E6Y5_9EURY|nr:fluoride efflux transporter CrcB [Haloplanus aerogenes]AZH24543.1 fluoride efflux transporter CrcB [Haloplanus aerogenes]RMB23803.1 protein CrcB [Haloplanus aerogenes]